MEYSPPLKDIYFETSEAVMTIASTSEKYKSLHY